MRHAFRRPVVGVLLCIFVGSVAGALTASKAAAPDRTGRRPLATVVAHPSRVVPPLDASGCVAGAPPTTIAYLAKTAQSTPITGLGSSGLQVAAATGAHPSDEVVVQTRTTSGALTDLATVKQIPGIQDAAPIYAQSTNPAFRSCDTTLSNSAADEALMADASRVFRTNDGMSADTLANAQWTVSDDALDDGTEIVTATVPGPVLPPRAQQPASITVRSVVPHMAFVDPVTDTVRRVVTGSPMP